MLKRKVPAANAKKSTVEGGERRSPVDLETVRELARIAAEFDLAEVEADASGRVRVSRRVQAAMGAMPMATAAPGPATSLSLMASAAEKEKADPGSFIASPFVGTFYRAPNPEAQPFADVGQSVRKGQVVCIVEAMKLMNEIESEFDGKILEVMVKNGEHVEYGQPLFRIQKS